MAKGKAKPRKAKEVAPAPAPTEAESSGFELEFFEDDDGKTLVLDWLRSLVGRVARALTLWGLPIILYLRFEMTKRKNEFDDFMKEVEREAAEAGETEALAAYGEHFRLALQVIRIRKGRHWTQQQFAKASGVPQSEISRIERGQANPTYRTLQMLAQAAQMRVGFVASSPKRKRSSSGRASASL